MFDYSVKADEIILQNDPEEGREIILVKKGKNVMTAFEPRQYKRNQKMSSFQEDASIFAPSQSPVPEPFLTTSGAHSTSSIDWQAEIAQAERFGISLQRLAIYPPAATQNQVIQRVVDAKSVSNVKSTTAVPDLPVNEATILEDACKNEGNRQSALDTLYAHLKGRGIVSEDEVDAFTYDKNSKLYGYTITSKKDDEKFTVFIYDLAFNAGAPVVYSTLRHELIHAEQQRLSADETANKDDPFFYHDAKRQGGEKGSAQGNVQHAVQEIETHAWEIENASATGITPDFVKGRRDELYTYYKNLCEYATKCTYQQQQDWKGYIDKAKAMAEQHLDEKNYPRMDIGWKKPKVQGTGKMKTEHKISAHKGKTPYDRE